VCVLAFCIFLALESNAPVGGILVTADVWEKVKDKFSFAEKRDVTVKGYGDAIEAYVVGTGNELI
jgi:class 3 adenylate cyclase